MSSLRRSQSGLGSIEIIMLVVLVGIISFVGWYIHDSKQTADKTLSSGQTSNTASKTDQSLESDLNSIDSANTQANSDLNNSSTSLSDQSTFTTLP